MLSSILKEHQSSQQRRRELEETRRIEAVNATNKLSHALVDHLNSGVAQAYINQVRGKLSALVSDLPEDSSTLQTSFLDVQGNCCRASQRE